MSGPINTAVDAVSLSADTGSSPTDFITKVAAQTISGTLDAALASDESVQVSYDGGNTWSNATSFAAGSSAWSTSGTLTGSNIFQARVVNSSDSGPVYSHSYTVDTTAPTAPSIPALAAGSDSGISNADRITAVNTPTFTGTAGEAGATIQVYDSTGTQLLASGQADGAGNWSATAATPLADGTYSIKARAVDVAGNAGSFSGSRLVQIDTAAPSAPTVRLAAASDTGSSASDGITSAITPLFTGNTEANATITLYNGASVIGSTTANAGGAWSITPSATLAEGTYSLLANATDKAGNTGAASTVAVTIDRTAPATPAALALAAGSDSGASTTDGITSVVRPTVTGSAEAGSTVKLYDTDGTTLLGTTIANGVGNWSIVSATLSSGAHSLTAKGVDIAGNTSVASSPLSLTIDVTAPAAPTASLLSSSDSGTIGDGITNVSTPTIAGNAEANATVTLYDTDGVTLLGSAVASNTGAWSISSSALANGSHTLTAKAVDVAGNVSAASSSHTVTIDGAAPTNIALNATTASLSAAGSGATIATLSSSDSTAVTYALATGNGSNDADNGSFAVVGNTLHVGSSNLAAGTYHIYLSAVDAAGNVSQLAQTFTVADAPTVTSIVRSGGAASGVPGSTVSANYTVTFSDNVLGVDPSDFVLRGTGTASGNVTGVSGSGDTYVITVDGLSGDGTLRLDLATSGTNIQTATGIAIASGYTAGASYTLDHTAPTVPSAPMITAASDSGTINDGITSVKTPTVSGTSEAYATVTLYDTGGSTTLGTTIADGLGHWSITSAMLSEGVHVLATKAVDASGNVSAVSGGLDLTIDAISPSVATIMPSTAGPTHATSLTYTVAFTEPVTGVIASAFTPRDAGGHAIAGSVIAAPISTDGGQTYTVTVSGLTGEGAVRLDLNAIGTGITDLAGNAILGGATGTSVTLDHVAPAITLALSADTGLNNHPLLTDAASGALVLNAAEFTQALRFGGTVGDGNLGTPSGALVTITAADGHAVPPHIVPLQSDGTYAFRVDAPGTVGGVNASIASALTDGTYTVVAYTQDAAGNIAQTAPTTLIVDTTADVGADAGLGLVETADHLINAVEARAVGFVVSGLDADASAVATFTDGTHTITANVAANGTGTVDLSGFNGTMISSLAVTDVHQNVASVVGGSVLVDTVGSLAPTSLVDLAIRNGFVNAAANTATQALTGMAEAGSTITVYDGATILGTVLADATTGRWAYTLGVLTEGAHTLSAIATDLAGNNGTVSSTLAFTVDTIAPTAPALALTHDTGVSATDGLTRDGTLALVHSEVGGTLSYTIDGMVVATYDPATLTQGAHTAAVTQTDAAGNVSALGNLAFTLDSLAPSTQADATSGRGLSAPLTGNVLANDTDASPLHLDSLQFGNGPAISVPTSGSAQIVGAHGTLTIASNGSYSYQATSFGHDVFTETVMDAAGNTSQTALTLNLDQTQEATFRFYDTKTGGHFFTASADEAAQVRASLPSFVQEGVAWATPDKGTDTVDVFRFYDTKTGDHFYTADVNERDGLIQGGSSYHYEGVAFEAFANEGTGGTAAVERFFNVQTGQHHYALAEEADGIRHGSAGGGWMDEGKAFVVQVAHHDLMA